MTTRVSFAFELRVVEKLQELPNTLVTHAWTFRDPVTEATREFDIRSVTYGYVNSFRLYLAVECTRVDVAKPLVVCCTRRNAEEDFYQTITPSQLAGWAGSTRTHKDTDLYRVGDWVGKRIVDYRPRGTPEGAQQESYRKWSQAVASAHELVQIAQQRDDDSSSKCPRMIIPVLAVPDDTLWVARFPDSGNPLVPEVKRVTRCSYFISHPIQYHGSNPANVNTYRISHVEIATLGGLQSLVDEVSQLFHA